MGPRLRLIVVVIVSLVIIVAAWVLLVSPERSKANTLNTEITAARASLATEQSQVAAGVQARTEYPGEVHAVNVLETAVPLSDEEPQLIRLINSLEVGHHINWTSATYSPGGASTGGFPTLNLGFSLTASYSNIQNLFTAMDNLTMTDGTNVLTTGRLFSIDNVSLTNATGGAAVQVGLTVYQLPAAPVTP
jgi:Tfp pilus assembly protein PilO